MTWCTIERNITFWNEKPFVYIISAWWMGNTWRFLFCHSDSQNDGKLWIVPVGVTIFHLMSSLHTASIYGRRGLSSKVGNLSLPVTTSSSTCARICTCGKRTRARKREYIADTVLNVTVSKCMHDHLGTPTVSEPAEKRSCEPRVPDSWIMNRVFYHDTLTPWLLWWSPPAFDVPSQPSSLTPADARSPANALLCHYAMTSSIGRR